MSRKTVVSIVPEGDPFNGPEHGGPVDMRDVRAIRSELATIRDVQTHHGAMLVQAQADLDWIKATLAELLTRLQKVKP